MWKRLHDLKSKEDGFGLLELLVVVIILGVLAAIAIPIYLQQQEAARDAATQQSLSYLKKAILAAKAKTGLTLFAITGNTCTSCVVSADTTNDPLTLPKTNTVWVNYVNSLRRISDASGMDVTNLVDGNGRPLFMDENEGEGGRCSLDGIAALTDPFAGRNAREFPQYIPLTSPACVT